MAVLLLQLLASVSAPVRSLRKHTPVLVVPKRCGRVVGGRGSLPGEGEGGRKEYVCKGELVTGPESGLRRTVAAQPALSELDEKERERGMAVVDLKLPPKFDAGNVSDAPHSACAR